MASFVLALIAGLLRIVPKRQNDASETKDASDNDAGEGKDTSRQVLMPGCWRRCWLNSLLSSGAEAGRSGASVLTY